MLKDPAIVRNRMKVEAAVNNAKRFIEVQKEFGSFDKYIWSFVSCVPKKNKFKTMKQVPAKTKESDALSKDLKKSGDRIDQEHLGNVAFVPLTGSLGQ